jgi:hypothetical protein
MAAAGSTAAEFEVRSQKFAKLISEGYSRSDCLRHAAENWGVAERTCDNYLKRAHELIREDWDDISRPQLMANLFAQNARLHRLAIEKEQLSVALGCVNAAARLAKLIT